MPRSSSPSHIVVTTMSSIRSHSQTLTLTLTPSDADDPLLHPFHLHPQSPLLVDGDDDPDPQTLDPHPLPPPPPPVSISSLIYRDDDEEDDDEDDEDLAAAADDEQDDGEAPSSAADAAAGSGQQPPVPYVDPSPHISSQFYTFNRDSYSLMVRCILEGRLATADEIRAATPALVLQSWRSVWKDRNEVTAYLTAWKRIQDKLHAVAGGGGEGGSLYFKNNPAQRVSYVGQWQDIVSASHADADLRHLGLKDTDDRIKQTWTVGAKFYGIPESFIRVCLAACHVCSSPLPVGAGPNASLGGTRSKRRRFEYTESFDVPACDVPQRLQQLAAKHKVVLCIRQKYIRYKPFMAEVKDYACHRAGEPSSASGSSLKKARVLKREPYISKRCGCGFRIRAIVPIANYNEKDKTFVYQEEGTAVFKLYAVHSGHEPGPLDGNARIIHRLVGSKGGFDQNLEVYGVREDMDSEPFVGLFDKDEGSDPHLLVLLQLQELKAEIGMLGGRIEQVPRELLGSVSHELSNILHSIRILGKQHLSDVPLGVDDVEVGQWETHGDHHPGVQDRLFGKATEIIEEDDADFTHAIGQIVPWGRIADCHGRKMLMSESCKPEKWLLKEDYDDFDEKSVLNCGDDDMDEEDSKLIKPLRHDGTVIPDPNIEGIPVDGFYHDSSKWYDSPCSLDSGGDAVDNGRLL